MTDLDIIVLFAIRYALPRDTSAPYSLLCYLSKHVDELSWPARGQMVKEIEEEMLPWEDWDAILRLLGGQDGVVAV